MSDLAAAAAHAATVSLAEKLRRLRQDRHVTQERAADAAGISRRNYQRLENNEAGSTTARRGTNSSNPRLDTLFGLAVVLEVEIAYLVDPDQPVDPVPPRRRWS